MVRHPQVWASAGGQHAAKAAGGLVEVVAAAASAWASAWAPPTAERPLPPPSCGEAECHSHCRADAAEL
eukprot:15236833-Alexandrium_andersonii.AAC.1